MSKLLLLAFIGLTQVLSPHPLLAAPDGTYEVTTMKRPSDPNELYVFLKEQFETATDPILKEDVTGWHAGGMVGHPAFPGKILPKVLVGEERDVDGTDDFRLVAIHSKRAIESQKPDYFENLDETGAAEVRQLINQYWETFANPDIHQGEIYFQEDYGNGQVVEHRLRKNGSYLFFKVVNLLKPDVIAYAYFLKDVTPAGEKNRK